MGHNQKIKYCIVTVVFLYFELAVAFSTTTIIINNHIFVSLYHGTTYIRFAKEKYNCLLMLVFRCTKINNQWRTTHKRTRTQSEEEEESVPEHAKQIRNRKSESTLRSNSHIAISRRPYTSREVRTEIFHKSEFSSQYLLTQ